MTYIAIIEGITDDAERRRFRTTHGARLAGLKPPEPPKPKSENVTELMSIMRMGGRAR